MKIGVFDSGIGGLSVARALEKAFPEHEITFVNDSQHVPYGSRKPKEILGFIQPIFQGLVDEGCGLIVVACNTVSTTLIKELRELFPVPLVAMEPMIKPAAEQTKTGIIAVCATPTTLASKRYSWLKEVYARDVQVIEPDCSRWSYMIEHDQVNDESIARQIDTVCAAGADVIVLGCTHYHWIEEKIVAMAAGRATVIQPEQAIVARVRHLLDTKLHSKKLYDTSKYQASLWFPDKLADAAYFEHDFQGYSLEGRMLYNQAHDDPWVLSIHGARADFTKSDAVSLGLQKRGYSVLGMNLSGHSEAGVLKLEETSLQNNVDEAEAFFGYLDSEKKKVVIAYSLGGTPALKLLEKHAAEIDKLVLFYPGIYSKDAYDKHFGSEFREVISKPYSYRDNDMLSLLEAFPGKLLLLHGQYDGLDPVQYGKPTGGGSAGEVEVDGIKYYSPIPKEVIDAVYDALSDDRKEKIVVPNCGHSIVLWMREHPDQAEQLLDKIQVFLQS